MFQSLRSCQKRFLWTHKEADLAPHQVVGHVLQVGDAEKFLQALRFKRLDPFFFSESASGVHVSQQILHLQQNMYNWHLKELAFP